MRKNVNKPHSLHHILSWLLYLTNFNASQEIIMQTQRRLLLVSTTKIYGSEPFEYMVDDLKAFFERWSIKRLLFIPYALSTHDDYTEIFKKSFKKLGVDCEIEGIHTKENPVEAVQNAQAIFIGGGNTFRLLKSLYDFNLIEIIRKRILEDGIPYLGSSAGTNVATISINTTNDMPIVYPPTFSALKLVPFNINPHFIDPEPNSTHMGETREKRINEYHEVEGTPPVIGLPEGTFLYVEGDQVLVKGLKPAILFCPGQPRKEYPVGADLSFLLN